MVFYTSNALAGLVPLLVLMVAGPAAAQTGMLEASSSAVASGPGQVASSVAVNSGGHGTTFTATSGGAGATAVAGTWSALGGCTTTGQATNAGGCGWATRTATCGGSTIAEALVGGEAASCCVVLVSQATRQPALFCASSAGGPQPFVPMPATASVTLAPLCDQAGRSAALACSVRFGELPAGFTYPPGATASRPLTLHVASPPFPGFRPCNSGRFTRFSQAVSGSSPLVLTSKCE